MLHFSDLLSMRLPFSVMHSAQVLAQDHLRCLATMACSGLNAQMDQPCTHLREADATWPDSDVEMDDTTNPDSHLRRPKEASVVVDCHQGQCDEASEVQATYSSSKTVDCTTPSEVSCGLRSHWSWKQCHGVLELWPRWTTSWTHCLFPNQWLQLVQILPLDREGFDLAIPPSGQGLPRLRPPSCFENEQPGLLGPTGPDSSSEQTHDGTNQICRPLGERQIVDVPWLLTDRHSVGLAFHHRSINGSHLCPGQHWFRLGPCTRHEDPWRS